MSALLEKKLFLKCDKCGHEIWTQPDGRGRPAHPNTAAAVAMVRKGSTRTAAAIHYGLSVPTVTLACQRAGIAPAKRGRPRGRRDPNGRDWSKTDWRKNNCQIARAIGLTPERVRQVRKELGKNRRAP